MTSANVLGGGGGEKENEVCPLPSGGKFILGLALPVLGVVTKWRRIPATSFHLLSFYRL
jgi:hypothetical protein